MNVVALVKYIPNPTGTPQMGDDFRLKREGVEGGLDPGDEHAVEAALQVAEASGGEVTFVTMGPEPALQAVRKALSMGGHKAVVVTDPSLKGADSLVTARVLAAAVKRSESDLGLSGEEAKPTQEVIGIEPVPEREAGEVVEDAAEAPAKVVDFLKKAKVI